jgi:predicted RNA binding protein YcfA (HicA-like mRNA interferase family)
MMGHFEKLIQKILSGRQDANINFSDIVSLMRNLGFTMRLRGSHHIFFCEGIEEIINIQPDGSKAKAYQVKQIRDILVKYRLGTDDE